MALYLLPVRSPRTEGGVETVVQGRAAVPHGSQSPSPSSSALPGPVLTVQGSGSHTLGSKRGKEQERERRLASREGANLGAEPPAHQAG